jgi:TRAP-type C4-dicarboxylate transport system permease small subunit
MTSATRLLRAISDWADRLTYVGLVPLGLIFVGVVFANVLARYVFSSPIIGSVEVARIAFVWATFLGAATALKRGKHIRFTILADRLPPGPRRWLEVTLALLAAGFFLFVIVRGIDLTGRVQGTYFPASGFSQVILYLPLPIGAGLMFIHTVSRLADLLWVPAPRQGGGAVGAEDPQRERGG